MMCIIMMIFVIFNIIIVIVLIIIRSPSSSLSSLSEYICSRLLSALSSIFPKPSKFCSLVLSSSSFHHDNDETIAIFDNMNLCGHKPSNKSSPNLPSSAHSNCHHPHSMITMMKLLKSYDSRDDTIVIIFVDTIKPGHQSSPNPPSCARVVINLII